MVRLRSFFALSLWLGGFVACGEFGLATDNTFGGGPVDGSVRNSDGGDAAVKPGGSVTQDAGPPVSADCELDKGPRYSPACVDETTGVFVRVNAVGGAGTKLSPYGSFTEALGKMGDKRFIFAAKGGYREDVRIERNVSIYGGFNDDFAAHEDDGVSEIIGTGATKYALEVFGGTEPLRFEDLKITGTASPREVSISSVAVYVHELATKEGPARFRRVQIAAADGQPGHGGTGGGTIEADFDPTPFVGDGWTCNDTKVNGGGGGPYTDLSGQKFGGLSGDGPARGSGGSSNGACTAASGVHGGPQEKPPPAAVGAIATGWDFSAEQGLLPRIGGDGAAGTHGSGGGGGGATKSGSDTYSGGRGGRGGCGGTGGKGGTVGGTSVAMLANQAFVIVEASSFLAGRGGDGGPGGGGGGGAQGENANGGGQGGSGCMSGFGGNGGWGQDGGSGGPGGGGNSVALLQFGPPVTLIASNFTPSAGGNTAGTTTKSGQELAVATLNGDGQMVP